MAKITIDGKEFDAPENTRLLTTLTEKGFKIPSLCFHHALTPAASCKLCVVEVKIKDQPPSAKLSCAVKVQDGMEVVTESAMIHKMRNEALGNLLKMAPRSERLIQIAEKYNLNTGFIPDGCIRCKLCIRVCKEVIGARALKMEKRQGTNYIVPREEGDCIGCGTCANICPTGAIRIVDEEEVRTIMIRDEVIGRHPLKRCEMCGKRFATPKFLSHLDEREHDAAHPEAKEHGRFCSTCIKLYSRKNQRLTPSAFSIPRS